MCADCSATFLLIDLYSLLYSGSSAFRDDGCSADFCQEDEAIAPKKKNKNVLRSVADMCKLTDWQSASNCF